MSTGYTEAELASLTPDERSALEADSATDDDAAVLEAIASEADIEDTDAATTAAAETDLAAQTAENTDAPADGKTPESAATDTAKPAEEPVAIQTDKTFHAEAPADIAEQRKALRAEDAAALKQLMDGEIDAADYAEIKDRVSNELESLVRAEVTADVSTKMAAQAKANEWARSLNAAVVAAKAEGLDYLGNKDLGGEFDSLLRIYSERAAQQGMNDDNLDASKWALSEANKMMRKMHAPAKTPVADTKKVDEPAAARHNLTTLAKMPAADRAPISDDVMAKMGSLQGEDLEKYMATLSSKEIERIMAGV